VIDPHVEIRLAPVHLPSLPAFDATFGEDPYFHPALVSACPPDLFSAGPAVSPPTDYGTSARILIEYFRCREEDLALPQQFPERVLHRPAGACHWFVPGFSNPYYGGVMTILRFADFLKRRWGSEQRFFLLGETNPAELARTLGTVFPSLAGSQVTSLDDEGGISRVPPSDFSFATLWTTAYELLRVRNTGVKAYFIQDYEPLFYPAGSTSAQVELTYRFGFLGIANTEPLKELVEREHGGRAVPFVPQVDPVTFCGSLRRASDGPRRVVFYGRPGHPRNGFELAMATMKELKRRCGDRVEIYSAGAEWRPEDFDLGGVVENLGLLTYEETADLYRWCHVGFVLMMTRHPSYLPMEMMACGALLVTNDNPTNRWLLKDGRNCLLAPPAADALAARLESVVNNYEVHDGIRAQAMRMVREGFSDWDGQFSRVASFLEDFVCSPATLHGQGGFTASPPAL
jgi:glycosyltransferase involved in cell wall biosynthesis